MLVPKSAFCVSEAVPSRDPRPVLHGVHVSTTKNKCMAEATDGKLALRAEWRNPPTFRGAGESHEEIVPKRIWKLAQKEAPAPSSDAGSMAALSEVVDSKASEFKIGPTAAFSDSKIEGRFPNIDAVMPKVSDATHSILAVDPRIIIRAAKAAIAAGASHMTFSVPKAVSEHNDITTPIPLSFDGKDCVKVTGLVMPVKLSPYRERDEEAEIEEETEIEMPVECE